MNVREMHNMLKLQLQRNVVNTYSNLTTEELDLALNEGQSRFIKTRYQKMTITENTNNRYQSSKKRNDDLRDLIVINKKLPAIKPSADTGVDAYMWEENMYYSILPEDYLFLLNDRTVSQYIKDNTCGELQTTDGTPVKEYISVLPYTARTTELCVNNPVFKIVLNSQTIFDVQDFAIKVKKVEEKHIIINLVLEMLNRYNAVSEVLTYPIYQQTIENRNKNPYFSVYWEKYKDMYYPDSFVFVSADSNFATITPPASDDDATYNSGNEGKLFELITNIDGVTPQSSGRFYQISLSTVIIDSDAYVGSQIITESHPNRLVDLEVIHKMKSFPFSKTTRTSPLSAINSQFLQIFTDGNFVPTSCRIDYIRKPRLINLELNQNCELAEHTHPEIVSEAVAFILEITSNQRYQQKVIDNMRNT